MAFPFFISSVAPFVAGEMRTLPPNDETALPVVQAATAEIRLKIVNRRIMVTKIRILSYLYSRANLSGGNSKQDSSKLMCQTATGESTRQEERSVKSPCRDDVDGIVAAFHSARRCLIRSSRLP